MIRRRHRNRSLGQKVSNWGVRLHNGELLKEGYQTHQPRMTFSYSKRHPASIAKAEYGLYLIQRVREADRESDALGRFVETHHMSEQAWMAQRNLNRQPSKGWGKEFVDATKGGRPKP